MSRAIIFLAVWGNLLIALLLGVSGYAILAPAPLLVAAAIFLSNSWSQPAAGERVAD